ncbi:MAG TPA: amidohydrolase family protein, partial [Thermodesulfobacteriota bacterium]|nr:amidohydrolase family protein [Thermodesulfobacteriota bacterium]
MMFKLIRNGHVYSPDDLGRKDILVCNHTIVCVEDRTQGSLPAPVEVYDAAGKTVLPGIIDPHVHFIGGGGSWGVNSRVKDICIEQIIEAGVTTAVGCLGFDRISRTLEALLFKTRGLEEWGMTAFMMTGSYSLPSLTISGSVEKDLSLIDKVIGVKLALGEPLANSPDVRDIRDLLTECLRGGHLGGKPGFLQIHMGIRGKDWKQPVMEALQEMKIPLSKVVFTHVNRSPDTLEEFTDYVRAGGAIDLTASYTPAERPGSLTVVESLRKLIAAGIPLDRVTMSSDSNATRMLPEKKIKYLPIQTIFQVTSDLWQSGDMPRAEVARFVTENPARSLGLEGTKGRLEPGKDADLIIVTENFELDAV